MGREETTASPDRLVAELAAYRGEIAVIEARLDDAGRAALHQLRITPRLKGADIAARGTDAEIAAALRRFVAPVAAVAPGWIRAPKKGCYLDFRHPKRERGKLDPAEVRALFDSLDCYVYKARTGLDIGPTDPTVDEGCSSSVEFDLRHFDITWDRTHPTGEALTALALLDSVCLRIGRGPDPVAPAPSWAAAIPAGDLQACVEMLTGTRLPNGADPVELLTEMIEGGAVYQLGHRRARASGWHPGKNPPWSLTAVEPDEDDFKAVRIPGAVERLMVRVSAGCQGLLRRITAAPVPIAGDEQRASELFDRAGWLNAQALIKIGRPVVAADGGHLVLCTDVPDDLVTARRAWLGRPEGVPKARPKRNRRGTKKSGTASKPADERFELFAGMKTLAAEGAVSGCMIKTPWGSKVAGFRWRPARYRGPRNPLWGKPLRVEAYWFEVFELRPAHDGYDRGHRFRIQHRREWTDKATSWPVVEGVDPIFALRRARAFVESCPGAGLAPPRGEWLLIDELAGKAFSPGSGDGGKAYAYIPADDDCGARPVEVEAEQQTAAPVGIDDSCDVSPIGGEDAVAPAHRGLAALPAPDDVGRRPLWCTFRFDNPDDPETAAIAEQGLHITSRAQRAQRVLDRHLPGRMLGCVVRDRGMVRGRVEYQRFKHWQVVEPNGCAYQTYSDPLTAVRRELDHQRPDRSGRAVALGADARLALPAPADSTPWSHGDDQRAARARAVLGRLRPDLTLSSRADPAWGPIRRVRWNCRTEDGELYTVSTNSPTRALRMALWHTPAEPGGEPIALGGRPAPTFVLVGCVKGKVETRDPVPVRDLYTGDLWARRRRYADARGLRWGVVSAKLGVVPSWSEARPYEMRIDEVDDVEKWRRQALRALARLAGRGAVVEALAGRAYIDALDPAMAWERYGILLTTPLEGMGIGERKRWLGEQADRIEQSPPPDRRADVVAQLVDEWPGACWWVDYGEDDFWEFGRDVAGELAGLDLPAGAVIYGMDEGAHHRAVAVLEPDGWWARLRGATAHRVAKDLAPISAWWPVVEGGLTHECCLPLDQAARWAARAEAQRVGIDDDAPIDWDRVDADWWRAEAERSPAVAEQLLADVEQHRAALSKLPTRGPDPSPPIVGPTDFAAAWKRRGELTVDRNTGEVRRRRGRQGRSKALSLTSYVRARADFAADGGDPDNNAHMTAFIADQGTRYIDEGTKLSRTTVIRRRRELEALPAGTVAELEAEVFAQGVDAVAVMAGASTAITHEGESFLYWTGGKGRMLPELLAELPKGPIDYCEPFLGGGRCIWRSPRRGASGARSSPTPTPTSSASGRRCSATPTPSSPTRRPGRGPSTATKRRWSRSTS